MIDLKGEKQEEQQTQGLRNTSEAGLAFCVIQTKGNSDGDSAAGHVRVLRGADACGSRHRRVVVQETKGE